MYIIRGITYIYVPYIYFYLQLYHFIDASLPMYI